MHIFKILALGARTFCEQLPGIVLDTSPHLSLQPLGPSGARDWSKHNPYSCSGGPCDLVSQNSQVVCSISARTCCLRTTKIPPRTQNIPAGLQHPALPPQRLTWYLQQRKGALRKKDELGARMKGKSTAVFIVRAAQLSAPAENECCFQWSCIDLHHSRSR